MADLDVDQWLESWAETTFRRPAGAHDKADLREEAKRCAAAAEAAGIPIVELKAAAGGDLETFLLERPAPAA